MARPWEANNYSRIVLEGFVVTGLKREGTGRRAAQKFWCGQVESNHHGISTTGF